MNKSLILALVAMLAAPAFAVDYSVGANSTLGFRADFQGEKFDGRFQRFDATIRYDADDLANSKFDVGIDLASAVTGDSDRDESLPGKDFFHVAKFPKAHYTTTGFRRNGDTVIADGTLDLKGTSKPVSLVVKFAASGDTATLEVTTTLKRLDFDVGSGDYADTSTIGNDVAVTGRLELTAK